jgi:peptide subunit release factor 1 (eRF1)
MATMAPGEPPSPAAVQDELERLIEFEPTTLPVISLYLNTQADKHGRDDFEQFVRKEFNARAKTFASGTPERESFDHDAERIRQYLEEKLKPSANGVAIFACWGAGEFFETLQLNVPIEEHRLYVYNQPHLYHLARLDDEYPRYAALLTDANSARIYVFGLGETLDTETVNGKKVQRVKVGGWSQARYQRRVQNAHRDHAKEAIEALERVVRDDNVRHVVIAGDPAMAPVLQDQLPKHLADKVVDVMRLDVKSSEQEIFRATLEKIREQDATTDAEKVERLFSAYRARGLAVLGPQDTLEALANGQVDELLISASLEQTHASEEPVDAIIAPEIPDTQGGTASEEPRSVLLADLLVTKARQTDARVSFIQDANLLAGVDGVGGFLRWRL